MSLFRDPEEHAANPPQSWVVVHVLRRWELRTTSGPVLGSFTSKRKAEEAKKTGFYADLYAKEGRRYAGEVVPGWKPRAAL